MLPSSAPSLLYHTAWDVLPAPSEWLPGCPQQMQLCSELQRHSPKAGSHSIQIKVSTGQHGSPVASEARPLWREPLAQEVYVLSVSKSRVSISPPAHLVAPVLPHGQGWTLCQSQMLPGWAPGRRGEDTVQNRGDQCLEWALWVPPSMARPDRRP